MASVDPLTGQLRSIHRDFIRWPHHRQTGTTSLAVALYSLGYDVCGYFGNEDPDVGEHVLDTAFALADHYDAVQDMPWPVLSRELDWRHPGSRFVLTVRPEAHMTGPWRAGPARANRSGTS